MRHLQLSTAVCWRALKLPLPLWQCALEAEQPGRKQTIDNGYDYSILLVVGFRK